MNPRDNFPVLFVAGLIVAIVALLGGAIAIGVVSMNDFTGATDAQSNTTAINPPDDAELPSGYYPTGISTSKAIFLHQDRLVEQEFQYEYVNISDSQPDEQLSLSVEENGTVTGNQTFAPESSDELERYEIQSEEGDVYTVLQNDTEVRTFANSAYANGGNFLKEILDYDTYTLDEYEESSGGYLYYYSFTDNNSSTRGGLIVSSEGIIHRAYVIEETEDGTQRTSFTLRVSDE